MSLITGSIKSILSIKIKHRHDSYSDQVSRIFVAKSFMVASLIMGVDWFHDTVFCVLPKNSEMTEDFVHSACWIQGFYVYPEMENHMRASAYYGIPKYVEIDGIRAGTNELCRSKLRFYEEDENCIPMEKHYFAHFQWMPFYIASLAILFYLPYIAFRMFNTDMISLRKLLKISKIETKDIVENYFNHKINKTWKMRLRVFVNIFIKCLYVGVNVFSFAVLDILLNRQFRDYGVNWTIWLRQNSSMAMDFSMRTIPTPGNKMLPTFGYCDIHELALDGQYAVENKNKVLCEISSNILYQYVLMVLWFVSVFAMAISVLGVVLNILSHLINVVCLARRDNTSKIVYRYLTFRECEYLEFIRQKNLAVYGNVVRDIKDRYKEDMEHMFKMKNAGGTVDAVNQEDGLNMGSGDNIRLGNMKKKNSLNRLISRLHTYESTA